MADRSLKGTGLGAKVSRTRLASNSLLGRRSATTALVSTTSALVFSAEADIPPVWECPRCGAESLRSDGERPELKRREDAAYPLGHASRAALHRRTRGTASRKVEPAAFGRVGLDRILAKLATRRRPRNTSSCERRYCASSSHKT